MVRRVEFAAPRSADAVHVPMPAAGRGTTAP